MKFGEFSSNELMLKLGLSSKTGAFKRVLKELLNNEIIAYTIPEKPHTKEQKYRLLKKDKEDQNAN